MGKRKLDDYHAHEAMDRVYMFATMMETYLLEHDWIIAHKDVCEKLREVNDLMHNIYQDIGREHL